MSAPIDWQSGFIAMSVLLGEPMDAVQQAVDGSETAGARELLRELSIPSKSGRARVLARIMTSIVASLNARVRPWGATP